MVSALDEKEKEYLKMAYIQINTEREGEQNYFDSDTSYLGLLCNLQFPANPRFEIKMAVAHLPSLQDEH